MLQVPLAPIHVANTLPFPLLAVLRKNSQAITQYCKVPQGFEGGSGGQHTAAASLSADRRASPGAWR